MNWGQKVVGNLTLQTLVLIAAASIVFSVGLISILFPGRGKRLSDSDAGWLSKVLPAGGRAGASRPSSTPTQLNQPVQVVSKAETNCTYPSQYWRDHPEAWDIENIVVGGFSYSKDQVLEILADESGKPARTLYQQFVTTALNTMKGADSSAVEAALVRASHWLESHHPDAILLQSEQAEALGMADELNSYNTGVTGPGLCEFQAVVVFPTATLTPSPSMTLLPPDRTATPTPTNDLQPALPTLTPAQGALPSATATLRSSPTAGVSPTSGASPTTASSPSGAPSGSPTPRSTPTPQPTPTAAPTEAPPPTETGAPSDTPSPSSTPEPPQPTDEPTSTTEPTGTSSPPDPPPNTPRPTNIHRPTPDPTNTPESLPTDVALPVETSLPLIPLGTAAPTPVLNPPQP